MNKQQMDYLFKYNYSAHAPVYTVLKLLAFFKLVPHEVEKCVVHVGIVGCSGTFSSTATEGVKLIPIVSMTMVR